MDNKNLSASTFERLVPSVCWVHTQHGDHYLGILGKKPELNERLHTLSLELLHMVSVKKSGGQTRWSPFGQAPRPFAFKFDGCRLKDELLQRIEITSAQGDTIIITSNPLEMGRAKQIIGIE